MDHVNPETAARQKRDRDAAQRTTLSQAVVHGLLFGLLNAVAVWVAVGGLLFGGDWLVDQGKSIVAGAFWGVLTAVCFYVLILVVWLSPRKRSWFSPRPRRRRKLEDMIPAGMSRATIALILSSFVAACALLGVLVTVGGSLEALLKKEPNRTLTLLLTTIGTSVVMGLLVSAGSYFWGRSQQSTVTPFDRPHEL